MPREALKASASKPGVMGVANSRLSAPLPWSRRTYPEDTLSYLANVFNQAAHAFYARHGVKLLAPAFEAAQELGEVSLMITKHCVRFSLQLVSQTSQGRGRRAGHGESRALTAHQRTRETHPAL